MGVQQGLSGHTIGHEPHAQEEEEEEDILHLQGKGHKTWMSWVGTCPQGSQRGSLYPRVEFRELTLT